MADDEPCEGPGPMCGQCGCPAQNFSGFGMREHPPVSEHKRQNPLLLEEPT